MPCLALQVVAAVGFKQDITVMSGEGFEPLTCNFSYWGLEPPDLVLLK